MTTLPFNLPAALQAGYARGYADAQQLPAIAAPALAPQTIDKHYAVVPGGALPTLPAAITQAQKDKSQWPGFHLAPGSAFTGSTLLPKGFAGITIDGGAAGSAPSTWATINSDASGNGEAAIVALNMPNVHVSRIVFNAVPSVTKPIPPRAIYSNGTTGLAVDNCIVNGFAIAVCSDGGDGTTITNCGFFNQSAPKIGKSQGVFLASSTNWTIAGNIFWHCGWAAGDYVSDKAHNDLLQLNHGVYVNNDSGLTTNGTIQGNIFCDCASNGIGSRVGGVYDYNVFRSNGLAADVLIQGLTGTVAHSTFLGPVVDQPPYYGGGIQGISRALIVNDCYFFSTATTPLNPAVRVDWPASNGALPAGTTASVDGIHGLWVRPAIGINASRPATQGVIDVRVPAAGQAVPSLEAFYGCAPAQLESTLRTRVGMNDAPAIHDWAARSWAVMNAPPVPNSPVPPLIPSVPIPPVSMSGIFTSADGSNTKYTVTITPMA